MEYSMTMNLLLLLLLLFVAFTEAQNYADSKQEHCETAKQRDEEKEFIITLSNRLTRTENQLQDLAEKFATLNTEIPELKQRMSKTTFDKKEQSSRFRYFRKTCYEWKMHGFTESGEYLIAPDGEYPPAPVFCDMSTGGTVVKHKGEELNVSSCSESGCHTEVPDYNMSKEQLKALVKESEMCQQYVRIECLNSPLFKDGKALTWWEDIDGNKQNAWYGNGCWCGEANNCIVKTQRCNCDSALPGQWLVDSGYITDSTKLPVSKLVLRGSGLDGQQMRFKLGSVHCHGGGRVSYPMTCRDLWLMGHFASGYYNVGPPINSQLVFCDMTRVFQNGYEAELSSPFTVMFYAGLRNHFETTITLKFDKVFINIGGGYEASTGMFTAPVPGIYMFHAKTHGGGNAVVFLRKNGVNQVTQDGVISTGDWSSNNMPFLTHLNKGDNISVFVEHGSIIGLFKKSYSSVFTGFLLKRTT